MEWRPGANQRGDCSSGSVCPKGLIPRSSLRRLRSGCHLLPGANFSPEGKGANYLRLSFAYLSPEKIREGIAVLAQVLKTLQPLKAPLPA